jgi:hypothetical protein
MCYLKDGSKINVLLGWYHLDKSVSYGIIKYLEVKIKVETKEEEGSEFIIQANNLSFVLHHHRETNACKNNL